MYILLIESLAPSAAGSVARASCPGFSYLKI
nr:MAG TPA: hypothetical protein [Caudoviricetes sp.]